MSLVASFLHCGDLGETVHFYSRRPFFTMPLLQSVLLVLMLQHGSAQRTTGFYPRHRGSMSGVRRGNGVVKSQDTLWITQGDGSLRIISIAGNEMSEIALFEPTKMTNRGIECKSSVSLHEINGVVQYGVYSVIDIPTSDNNQTIVSRVLAVSPLGQQLRETIVAGIAVGTPQISGDGRTYVIHNDFSPDIHGGYNFGKLSMIGGRFGLSRSVDLNGATLFGVTGVEREAPFGPISSTARIDADSEANLYFGESWGNGEAAFGLLYEFNGTHVKGLTRIGWSTVVPPTLSRDGKSMWIGGSASSVHGWVRNHPFKSQPSWSTNLGFGPRPILTKPLVTSDNELLFVLTPHHQVFCLNATSGKTIWGNDGQVVAPDTMQLSGDDSVLFTIGTDEGLFTEFDARTGRILSQISCHDLHDEDICTMPVEGGLAISSEEKKVYIGDIYGDIVALHVDRAASALDPTSSPSNSPSRKPATTSPSSTPSIVASSSPSSMPSGIPSPSPSLIPSVIPSPWPSSIPSVVPSILSTSIPSVVPSALPSSSPTAQFSASPTEISSLQPSIFLVPVDAPVFMKPLDQSVAPVSVDEAVVSPVYARSPASSSVQSPASMPVLPPAQPPTDTVLISADAPSVVLAIDSVSSIHPATSLEPSRQRIDLKVFEINLESLRGSALPSEESSTTSVGSYVALVAVVMLVMLVVGAGGVLVGRIWQHRRDKWYKLPSTDHDAWFGQDNESRSLNRQQEQTD